MSWPERYPGRLEYELQDFIDRGLTFAIDDSESRRTGRIVLRGQIPHGGENAEVLVVYPEHYPLFRPEVYAPSLRLARHQNPIEGNLCLLDRATSQWNVDDTAAWLVTERVPLLLALLEGDPDAMRAAEVPQGEPASAFMPWERGTFVLVPAAGLVLPIGITSGALALRFGTNERPARFPGTPWPQVRALLDSVTAGSGRDESVVAEADEALRRRFQGQEVPGRWVRLPEPPVATSASELAELAVAQSAEAATPRFSATIGDAQVSVVGVLYDEEVEQGVIEPAWAFIIHSRSAPSGHEHRRSRGAPQVRQERYLVRGERYSMADLRARIPRTAGMEDRTFAVAGLGSLGAPFVGELGRAQAGKVHVLDDDLIEAGTTVRWPYGLSAINQDKTQLIGSVLASEHPLVDVAWFRVRIGDAGLREGPEYSEAEMLDQFLSGADVVVDATAVFAVGHLLGTVARDRGIPLIMVSATEGAWGGRVVRLLPGATGCWQCLQMALMSGDLLSPPAEPAGTVQPRGCATRTFTGAGYDLTPLVAQAARVTIRTALAEAVSADDAWPAVHVMELHTGNGPLPAPRWSSHQLLPNPECELCGGVGH